MKIIRGATTAGGDTKEEISLAVKELLDTAFRENALKKEEVSGIVFSLTADLHSFHPAKAARECGYAFAPLFACVEPEIEGGLARCIRVMILTEISDRECKHIYLRGAKILRKDLSGIVNIALDGPAGSGKSTVAKRIAEDYKILCLDTGAMYRACALKVLKLGLDIKDKDAVERAISEIDLKVEYRDGKQYTLLDGMDVSEEIRKNEVSMAASSVSAYPRVREKMVEMQRKIAGNLSCVLDGRDIGSTVLPNAEFKFFVTADARVRAERRLGELRERGEKADLEVLVKEIEQRDKQDCEREFSPLKRAEDAVLVDTTDMTVEEAVSFIESHIQAKI